MSAEGMAFVVMCETRSAGASRVQFPVAVFATRRAAEGMVARLRGAILKGELRALAMHASTRYYVAEPVDYYDVDALAEQMVRDIEQHVEQQATRRGIALHGLPGRDGDGEEG